jgi:uncharacterized protein YggL (DUF469 family)
MLYRCSIGYAYRSAYLQVKLKADEGFQDLRFSQLTEYKGTAVERSGMSMARTQTLQARLISRREPKRRHLPTAQTLHFAVRHGL